MGAPPPAPPPQTTQSHRGSVSSSLSNLSSVSSMSTPTSQPWYRASQPRISSARAAHLSEKLGHSAGHSTPNHLSDKLSGYDTSTTARSSRGSSSSSTDSLASWSSREARDREGEVRPAGLGEVRSVGGNSNGDEGKRMAPLEQGRGIGGLQAVELKKVRTLY